MDKLSSEIVLHRLLGPLDWTIFIIIFILTICSVIYGNKLKKVTNREENFLDFLLMGRRLTLPLFVATLVATWYGGIFGVTQIAFEYGIYNFLIQGIFWYITYLIFAFFLVKKIRNYEAVTLPDLVSKMYGPKSAKLAAVFNIINVTPVVYVISLGLFLQTLFGGDLKLMIIIGTSIVVLYSLMGGFRAVVFSDLVQFAVMCISVLIILLVSINNFGGLAFLRSTLPERYFIPTGGNSLLSVFVWGFIALTTLISPNFYQRCFAAKSTNVARRGIIISTVIWFCFDICTTFGAMYARAIIPSAQANKAYLIYSLQILPPGLRGFILAGILATILSTIDSYIFIAGTTLAHDLIFKKWKKNIMVHKLGIILVAFWAIILAFYFKGNIRLVWKTVGSYFAACLLFPILYGYIFPKNLSDKQFLISSTLGILATTYWTNTTHIGFWNKIDSLYIGLLATSLGLIITSLIQALYKSRIK